MYQCSSPSTTLRFAGRGCCSPCPSNSDAISSTSGVSVRRSHQKGLTAGEGRPSQRPEGLHQYRPAVCDTLGRRTRVAGAPAINVGNCVGFVCWVSRDTGVAWTPLGPWVPLTLNGITFMALETASSILAVGILRMVIRSVQVGFILVARMIRSPRPIQVLRIMGGKLCASG